MPRAPRTSVPALLNQSQEGVAGHARYAELLWGLQQQDSQACWDQLCAGVHHLLCLPEVGLVPARLCLLLLSHLAPY